MDASGLHYLDALLLNFVHKGIGQHAVATNEGGAMETQVPLPLRFVNGSGLAVPAPVGLARPVPAASGCRRLHSLLQTFMGQVTFCEHVSAHHLSVMPWACSCGEARDRHSEASALDEISYQVSVTFVVKTHC